MLVGALALVLILIALLIYLIVSRTSRESAARAKANAKQKQARPIASSRVASGVFKLGGREAPITPEPAPQVPPQLQDYPLPTETLQQKLIIYTACRIGDAIAYLRIDDIEGFGIDDTNNCDLFWWRQYVDAGNLSRLRELFKDAGFKRKANRLINNLG